MGLVQRQSLKYTFINFAGTAIGIMSVMFLYPRALAEYGLLRWLLDAGLLLFPFLTLGMPPLVYRFFPRFRDEKGSHHGFLFLCFLWTSIGFSLFLIAFWLFSPDLKAFLLHNRKDAAMLEANFDWLPLLALGTMWGLALTHFSINFRRTTVPSLFNDLQIKITLPLIIGAFLMGWISANWLVPALLVHFSVMILGLIFYLKKIGQWRWRPDFSKIDRPLGRELGGQAIYGILLGGSQMALGRIDGILVGTMIGLASTGIYSISAVIAGVLEVPYRAVTTISTPLLANFWQKQDLDGLRNLYEKSSLNLLIIGLGLFGCIALGLEPLFQLLPNAEKLAAGKNAALILAAAKLFDMATGLNNHLIIYSKKYFWHLGATVLLGISNICFLLFLVPKMGLEGAAWAVFSSVVLFNLLTMGMVYRWFDLQPFSKKSVLAVFVFTVVFAAVWFLPKANSLIINLLCRSGLFAVLFAAAVLGLKISVDLDAFWQKARRGKLW